MRKTAGSTLTAQQPDNNVVRVGLAGHGRRARRLPVAAHQRPDEALRCRPSERGIALRTQQIVAHESGSAIHRPLGGSWAVESLTDELEARGTTT